MPSRERLRSIGIHRADEVIRAVGADVRRLRIASGVSQDDLSASAGVSRRWLARLEHGTLTTADLRRIAVVLACLGQKLTTTMFPTGPGIRDSGQLRLLERFNARIPPSWRRVAEAVMPIAGDLRAWDVMLIGPVRIGVEAETRPSDLQAIDRRMAAKLRDSGVERMILVVSRTTRNLGVIREHIGAIRQSFPLDTRETLTALAAGRDPGANGLVVI